MGKNHFDFLPIIDIRIRRIAAAKLQIFFHIQTNKIFFLKNFKKFIFILKIYCNFAASNSQPFFKTFGCWNDF